MTPFVVLLDANVLYPASLRDLLMQMAAANLYRAHWSPEIEEEWKRNLLSARPNLSEKIDRTQAVMRNVLPDALVTDYADKISDIRLPDPEDRHVVAAAMKVAADTIVTFNLRDFPREALERYGLMALHPDEFLHSFTTTLPAQVLECVQECLCRLVRPPVSAADYLAILDRLGLRETAAFLAGNWDRWQN